MAKNKEKEEVAEKAEKVAEKAGALAVGVFNANAELVKEFSAEAHGVGFTKKAEEWANADKNKIRFRGGYTIKKLR